MRHRVIKIALLAALLFSTSLAYADAVTFNWSTVTGATSYKLYQSADLGVTWTVIVTTGTPPISLNVPADKLYLYRVSAINATGETIQTSHGTWYNGLWETAPKQLTNQ